MGTDRVNQTPTMRELVERYKSDPGSLTPAQLEAVERRIRRVRATGPQAAQRDQTKEQVAQAISVHPRTVQRYAGEGMPHTAGGHGRPHLFNLGECLQWLMEQGRPPFNKLEPDGDGKAGADLKLKREKGRLAELDRLEREGALHDTTECRERHIKQLWAFKRTLLALPRSLAPDLEGRGRGEIEALVKERIMDILSRFAGTYVGKGA
jgi:phage terminase Nu1 subunit (DNA packaging protein)